MFILVPRRKSSFFACPKNEPRKDSLAFAVDSPVIFQWRRFLSEIYLKYSARIILASYSGSVSVSPSEKSGESEPLPQKATFK